MPQRKFKFFITIALVLIVALTTIGPAWANELNERQGELGDVQGDIQDAANQKHELEQGIKKLQAEIDELDNELAARRKRVDEINTEIKETEITIKIREQEIAETEEFLEEQTEYLENRMRAMYQRGDVGYLEVLLSATSFSDFVSRFNFLRTMVEDDVQLVEEIKEKKEFLEVERVEQVKRKESLVSLGEEAVKLQKETEEKIAEQDALSREMYNEMNKVSSRIQQMERAAKDLESEIAKIEGEIRREQEKARERERRQEEAAQQAPSDEAPSGGSTDNGSTGGGSTIGETGKTTGSYTWPVPEFGYNWITSPFGPRWGGMHWGIDIGIPRNRWPASPTYNGTPANVVAADGGEVIIVVGRSGAPTDRGFLGNREGGGYGRYVAIYHDNGHVTVYAHLHDVYVSVGQQVGKGQAIGTVGSTGNSTGPHLHFEIRVDGQRVNPLNFY